MSRLRTWLPTIIGTALRFIPPWVFATVMGTVAAVAAVWLAWLAALPGYAICLVAIWTVAPVVLTCQAAFWLYWRVRLLRLLRAADRLIPEGRERADALIQSRGTAMAGTAERRAEDWRTEMHAAVLDDPRIGPYRDQLVYRGGQAVADFVLVPLEALEALRDDLRQRF
jgi:hypothetical protein